jgi:hypothetical protein
MQFLHVLAAACTMVGLEKVKSRTSDGTKKQAFLGGRFSSCGALLEAAGHCLDSGNVSCAALRTGLARAA